MLINDFQRTLEASGTLTDGANIQYLCMLVRGKVICQIDMCSDEMVSTTSEHLKSTILVLDTYFFPVIGLSKQKRVMQHGMSNPCSFKVRQYADCIIDINNYLAVLYGVNSSDKNFETELNEFLLNNMPNRWSTQSYVKGFGC